MYGGVEFAHGAASFADVVVSYNPQYSGGNVPTHPNFLNPSVALGVPDHAGGDTGTGSVSLGSGGRLVVRFTNNLLRGSNSPAADLFIFEVGTDVEATFVDISKDGITWHSVGRASGTPSTIDIDAYGFTTADYFSWIRVTDDPNNGGTTGITVGADVDAIGAISSVQDYPPLGIDGAHSVLTFPSQSGSLYTVQQSTNLLSWTDYQNNIPGDGTEKQIPFQIIGPRRFFRLKPPP